MSSENEIDGSQQKNNDNGTFGEGKDFEQVSDVAMHQTVQTGESTEGNNNNGDIEDSNNDANIDDDFVEDEKNPEMESDEVLVQTGEEPLNC